jgi:hypothetical protein
MCVCVCVEKINASPFVLGRVFLLLSGQAMSGIIPDQMDGICVCALPQRALQTAGGVRADWRRLQLYRTTGKKICPQVCVSVCECVFMYVHT